MAIRRARRPPKISRRQCPGPQYSGRGKDGNGPPETGDRGITPSGLHSRNSAKKILKGEWRGSNFGPPSVNMPGFTRITSEDIPWLPLRLFARQLHQCHAGRPGSVARRPAKIGGRVYRDWRRTSWLTSPRSYTELFEDTKRVLDADRQAKTAVERWGFSAEDWAKMIARQSASQPSTP